MDKTICSERRILNEQWLLEKPEQTVAVPLQSAVQSAYINKEMTTTAFSSNITSQIHLIFYAEEDQTSVYQCKMIIFYELSTAIQLGCLDLEFGLWLVNCLMLFAYLAIL